MCHGECDVIIADNQSLVAPTEFWERALAEMLPEFCTLLDVLVKSLTLFCRLPQVHAEYMKELQRVYDRYKNVCYPQRVKSMVIH